MDYEGILIFDQRWDRKHLSPLRKFMQIRSKTKVSFQSSKSDRLIEVTRCQNKKLETVKNCLQPCDPRTSWATPASTNLTPIFSTDEDGPSSSFAKKFLSNNLVFFRRRDTYEEQRLPLIVYSYSHVVNRARDESIKTSWVVWGPPESA